MSTFAFRTDLAAESRDMAAAASAAAKLEGVDFKEYTLENTPCQELTVQTPDGAAAIGKPLGTYYTLSIASLLRREDASFENTTVALSELVTRLAESINTSSPILVVGLGNRAITPDAVGPQSAALTLVTRHLKDTMPDDFRAFSPVSVIAPGVLGTSGIESFDYIKAVCELVHPALVVAIDALAARSIDRLCTTLQITDSGISPGSGVGNARPEISKSTLGVPVIAIGVPTVVDLRSAFLDHTELQEQLAVASESSVESMIVTPRSIDALITSVSRVIAYGLNLALHPGLTIADIDMLLC